MSKKADLILFDRGKGIVTITEEALKVYGNDLGAYADMINRKTGLWDSVNLLFPSSIAVVQDKLIEINKLASVRVFPDKDRNDVNIIPPLKQGEKLKDNKGETIDFSGFQKSGDMFISKKWTRCPFAGEGFAPDDLPRMDGDKENPKAAEIYKAFAKNWEEDNTSVIIDNFKDKNGRLDASVYLDQLDEQELKCLASDIKATGYWSDKNLFPGNKKNKEDYQEYISQYLAEEMEGPRHNEYVFKHLCLDSAFNGDKFGILAEDQRRRTLTLDTDVVSFRTLDRAINENLRTDGYIKDNLKFESRSGGRQEVYLDMLKQQEERERNLEKGETMPKNRFILRSVEFAGEISPLLGERQEARINEAILKRESQMKGGQTVSPEEIQAMRDMANAELLGNMSNLRTVRINSPVILKNMFRNNEYIEDLYMGDNVENVDDFAFKNSLISRVHGGRGVRRYGTMAMAQTIIDDKDRLSLEPGKDTISDYLKTPYRENTKRSGFWKGSQEESYKGIKFMDPDAFRNVEEFGDGSFMNSGLRVGHSSSCTQNVNQVRCSEKLKKVGKFALFNTNLEGASVTTIGDNLLFDEYSFGYNRHFEKVSFGDSASGRGGVDYAVNAFAYSGISGLKSEDRYMRTEGCDELRIDKKAKYGQRAFAYANIKKIAIGAAAVGGLAKAAFAGCFSIRQITVPESIGTILISPFQLAGAAASLLYRHTLKPYVDRALKKWLNHDPDGFYSTADKLGRDNPDALAPVPAGPSPDSPEPEPGLPGPPEPDRRPDPGNKETIDNDVFQDKSGGKLAWLMFMELYKMASQRGLGVDDYLDSMNRKPDEGLVATTDYTEINDDLALETKDPENPQRGYPQKVLDLVRFSEKNGVRTPAVALPPAKDDSIVATGDRLNTHINGYDEEGNKSAVTVLSTTPVEIDHSLSPEAQDKSGSVVLSLTDDEMRKFYLERTGVDITKPDFNSQDILKLCGHLGDIAKEDYAKYMDIAKTCTCEYLYRREAKGNDKEANSIYQNGMKQLFTKSVLDQIADTNGLSAAMEKQRRNPDSILLDDGTKIDCSWNKVRGKDEFAFSISTTRPIETGMTRAQMLKKYPFVCEKSEALGRCHLYKSHPAYQELLSKYRSSMVKPFMGDIGDSNLGIKYDKKSDTYSMFIVNKTYKTNIPTTMDAEKLLDFTSYMANSMVGCMAFGDKPCGIRPNRNWHTIGMKFEGMSQRKALASVGIGISKSPQPGLGGQERSKEKSYSRGL